MNRINRRSFLASSASMAAVAGAATFTIPAIEGCSSSWITTVEQDIPIVVGIINSVLQVVSAATGTGVIAAAVSSLVSAAVQGLSAGLQALQNAVDAYQANKAGGLSGVISALLSAQKDAKAVIASLPAGAIDATWQTVIIAGLGTAITILSSLQALIPGAAPAGITAHAQVAAAKQTVILPNGAALKTGFNSVLYLTGYASAEVK
jgi:hypothetical protein